MSRMERVESLMKREIADILHKKIEDARIGFISLTGVEISSDFAVAKIFYSEYGPKKERDKTAAGLKSASGFIKGEIGKRIRLQTIPDLVFVYDDSLKRGSDLVNKINALDVS